MAIEGPDKILTDSRRFLEVVLSGIQEGISILSTDLTVMRINNTMEKWYGSSSGILGKKCFEAYHQRVTACEGCPTLRCIQTGKAESEIVPGPPGSNQWVELFCSPILDGEDGSITGVIEYVRDITRWVESENQLREGEQKFCDIFNNVNDIILYVGKEGRIFNVNRRVKDILGVVPEDLIGLNLSEAGFLHADGSSSLSSLFQEDFSSHKSRELTELELRHKNGENVPVEVSTHFVKKYGIVTGYIIVARNISARKLAEKEKRSIEEQLRQFQKLEAIGLLAGGIAHDFNNILSGIINQARLIQMKKDDPEKVLKYAGRINQTAMMAGDMINQLLTFARKAPVEMKVINIHSCIRNTMQLLKHTIDRRIAIHDQLSAEDTEVIGDASQIENSLLNIGINARDAMPEGGTLTFITRNAVLTEKTFPDAEWKIYPGNYIEIIVSDTGTGMDEETRKRIFEPFFTTKERGKGTGLGLASVYGSIKQHLGYVTVESNSGSGTSFHIYIPTAVIQFDEEPSAKIGEEAKVKNACIMVVDDDDFVRETAAEILDELGYRTIAFGDAQKALVHFRESAAEIDLVLLDRVMPGMNGVDCLRGLRKINPDIPVILSTGYLDKQDEEVFRAEGISDVIQKPFDIDDFANKIARALGPGDW